MGLQFVQDGLASCAAGQNDEQGGEVLHGSRLSGSTGLVLTVNPVASDGVS